MAKGIKHSVTVGGKTFTRTSPRVYTHAIIGRYSAEKAVANVMADRARQAQSSRRIHAEHVRTAANPPSWYTQELKDLYAAEAAKPVEQKVAEDHQAALDCARSWASQDGHDQLHVLQWSMSEANARKGMGKFQTGSLVDVQVVPVQRKRTK